MTPVSSRSGPIFGVFSSIWIVAFGYALTPGENPRPFSCCAREYWSGQAIELRGTDLGAASGPLPVGPDVLIVCFDAAMELWCVAALGWPMPAHVLDLYSVFRVETAGVIPARNTSLYQALLHYQLPMDDASIKTAPRAYALRGGYSAQEAERVIVACRPAIEGTTRLFERIGIPLLERATLPQMLLYGLHAKAIATIQTNGVPLDRKMYRALGDHGHAISRRLLEEFDQYGIWQDSVFSQAAFEDFLRKTRILWPRTPAGHLKLDDGTFKEMSLVYPELGPVRNLRKLLPLLRKPMLSIGADGRNRCPLFPLGSDTGRNQPSSNRFVLNIASCLRGLVQPSRGRALAYLDWEQQEFGCAAYLSGDPIMITAYESGDPYLAFGKQAGLVPSDATKATHSRDRELFKMCMLAVQYGMGVQRLAHGLAITPDEAEELLRAHRRMYAGFWEWSSGVEFQAQRSGRQSSPLGWLRWTSKPYNARSVCNFPMQSAGADMLRLACCLGVERDVMICAPHHDAVLIEAPADEIDHAVTVMRTCMNEASGLVLGGAPLRSEVRIIRHPDRLVAAAHLPMWEKIVGYLSEGAADD